MAFNQEAIDVWGSRMSPGGVLLYDPRHGTVPPDYPFAHMQMSAARDRHEGNRRAHREEHRRAGVDGERARHSGRASRATLVAKQFKRKGEEVVATNLKAFDAGLAALERRRASASHEARAARVGGRDRLVASSFRAISRLAWARWRVVAASSRAIRSRRPPRCSSS